MRLAVTSDLHVDHHPEVVPLLAAAIRALEPDVLVVAGDVSAYPDVLERTLEGLRDAAPARVFVPGNHDLWRKDGQPTSRALYEEVVPARVRAAGFHAPFADAVPPTICGHRFAGVTGWFDYSLRNRALDGELTREHYETGRYRVLAWSDKTRIHWPGDDGAVLDDPGICDVHVRALEAQLAAVGDEPTVVVTHHLPFEELVTSKDMLPWDFLNGFMGATRLGDAIRRAPGVRLAIAGHTHFRKEAVISVGGRSFRALTSPLGYPREYRRAKQTLAERVRERVTLVEI